MYIYITELKASSRKMNAGLLLNVVLYNKLITKDYIFLQTTSLCSETILGYEQENGDNSFLYEAWYFYIGRN